MEIGCSSGDVTVGVTSSRKLPLALPKQSEDFYHEKNRKWGYNATGLNPRRTETGLHLVLVCLLRELYVNLSVVRSHGFLCIFFL